MNRPARAWSLVALAVLLAVGVFVTWRFTRGSNGLGVTSVVLITLDTVRADRLGCYGGEPGLTPNLDRLAAEGVRFERCLATAPITLPSHASILSGTDPIAHGVRVNGAAMFDPSNPSLAKVLREAGFATGAFVSASVLGQRYGLDVGFDEYDDRTIDADGESDPSRVERRGERTVDAALAFVDRAGFSSFFLWVHIFDPHAPYEAPPAFGARHDDPYDAEIAYADWCVGKLLKGLEEKGRLAESLVAVVADHGEGRGDHGESTHTVFVYDSTIRVPEILWSKGRLPEGAVIERPTSIISLAPTILDLLRLERPPAMYGPSMAALATGGQAPARDDDPVLFESAASSHYYGFAPLVGIESAGYKLIVAPRPELYLPATDPGEADNLFAREPAVAGRLKRILDEYVAAHETERAAPRPLDPDVQEKLRELGYVASRGPSESGGGRDPKDGIHIVEALQRATLLEKDDPERAITAVQELIVVEPEVTEAFDILAELLASTGDTTGALLALKRALKLSPTNPDLYLKQAVLRLRRGEANLAEDRLAVALEINPTHVRARVQLGLAQLGAGRLDEARRNFDEILQRHPDVLMARVGRADCLMGMNNVRLADQDLRAALAEDPRNIQVLMRLIETSMLLVNPEDALLFYRRAAAIDPAIPLPEGLMPPDGE